MAGQLNVEILESRTNKLIKRRELIVRITHFPQGTPSRKALREYIANTLKVDPDLVYVRKMLTKYGTCESLARVHVYDSLERALQIEPGHVVRRNRGVEKGEKSG
ncbi:MAG: hypothetical protein NZ954_01340 [Thermofilaceae archaeon]|nr:hypothetical protein [Thermofilaceae archaeon]MCX8180486.1 hypothetical protein [Thermofilaceae archaeon]MDW8003317.1 hypothetical protein [Thermofilaceae archaeon]